MPVVVADSMKLRDVRCDPRVALHSPTTDEVGSRPEDQHGDAKLARILVETQPRPDGIMFRLDITEAALIQLVGGQLVIQSWHPGRGLQRRTRPI